MVSSVNDRLKEVRKIVKLNQEQFSKEIGISRAHVSNMENGNDNPSSALIKLICIKFNIDEQWLIEGVGAPTPMWDIRTDEGIIAKYNAMRVLFEKKLKERTGDDLLNSVEAFSYFDALLSPGKLSAEDQSKFIAHICTAFDEYEKLLFAVSASSKALFPSKNDTKGWLRFRAECEERLKAINDSIRNSINLYMALYGDEMKL